MTICGQCNGQFENDGGYLSHICPVTGVDPTHPLTMGADFKEIQKAALQRHADEAAKIGDDTQVAAQQEAITAVENDTQLATEANVVS